MAAAGGGDDALAALDALRSRVVATGGPAGVSKTLALEWLSFAEAPLPVFERDAAGKLVIVASATASKKTTYAAFYTPKMDG